MLKELWDYNSTLNQNTVQGCLGGSVVNRPTSLRSQSQFVSSSPSSGSLLAVQSQLQILCLPLSAPPQLTLSSKNEHLKKQIIQNYRQYKDVLRQMRTEFTTGKLALQKKY